MRTESFSKMSPSRTEDFDQKKAYQPQEEEGTAFVGGSIAIPSLD